METTTEEKLLAHYIDQESGELLVHVREITEFDGYTKACFGELGAERLVVSILTMAAVKAVLVLGENQGKSVVSSFIDTLPEQVVYLKKLMEERG